MRPASWLSALLLAALAAGCGDDPTSAGPAIFVEKWDPEAKCFAACPGQTPLSADITLGEQCASPAAACGFRGGQDTIRVTVDLGDVDIPRASALAAPRLDLVMDAVTQTAANAFPPRVPGDTRAYFIGSLPVPAVEVQSLTLRADLSEGFGATSVPFSVEAPAVSLASEDCDAAGCALQAGVGKLTLTITAPKGGDAKAILSVMLDGVPSATSAEVPLSKVDGTLRSGVASLDVPAPEGVEWSLEAAVGAYLSPPLVVTLADLALAVDLPACDGAPTCQLAAGQTVTLVVSAPRDVLDRTATVAAKIDGLLSPATFDVELSSVEGELRVGAAKITVPSEPGKSWQLLATIGESTRKSVPVEILPNP